MVRVALSGAQLFAWVFIFQYFYVQTRSIGASLAQVLLTYALSQIVVALTTPFAAQLLRGGFRIPLIASLVALASAFAFLAAGFSGSLGDIALGVALFALFSGLYRGLYWVPYSVEQAHSRMPHREWVEILVALVPLLAGLYLTREGGAHVTLLQAAAVVSVFAIFPVLFIREAYEGFAWKYRETFHELFDQNRRLLLWSSILAGIEGAVLFVLWPITVFTLIDWSYPLLGVVMSLTLLFTIIAKKLFGDAIRSVPETVQPLLAASGWIMRLGVGGFVGAVLVDTYFHTASRSGARGLDLGSHEQAADNSTYIDEHTALKEVAMALGRVFLALVATALLNVFALPHALAITFALAALAAGFSVHFALKPRAVV